MGLETVSLLLKFVFLAIAYNFFLSWFLGALFTVPYMRKQLSHIKDPAVNKGIILFSRIPDAIAYAVYITKDIPREDSVTEDIYGRGFSFRKHARRFDMYVAYSIFWGFIGGFALGAFIQMLDYFFL